jgi:hypothetical protein
MPVLRFFVDCLAPPVEALVVRGAYGRCSLFDCDSGLEARGAQEDPHLLSS